MMLKIMIIVPLHIGDSIHPYPKILEIYIFDLILEAFWGI